VRSNDDLENGFSDEWITTRTGIKERRTANQQETIMGKEAAVKVAASKPI
jgi:3-oxoacyl-[acyl-carrier-protein] synthase-3